MRSGLHRKLEYSDYAAIPDDGKRYELIEGTLHVTPAPNLAHQHALKRLLFQLVDYFEGRGVGEVFPAPTDVILTPHDVVQPDLVVGGTPEQMSKRGIEGVPLLVVEILSPASRIHDRKRKWGRYSALGVLHYWLVDPEVRRMECYRLENGRYVLASNGEDAATVAHPDWPGLTIDLASLWR
jgi:Uma2 family endonuclease